IKIFILEKTMGVREFFVTGYNNDKAFVIHGLNRLTTNNNSSIGPIQPDQHQPNNYNVISNENENDPIIASMPQSLSYENYTYTLPKKKQVIGGGLLLFSKECKRRSIESIKNSNSSSINSKRNSNSKSNGSNSRGSVDSYSSRISNIVEAGQNFLNDISKQSSEQKSLLTSGQINEAINKIFQNITSVAQLPDVQLSTEEQKHAQTALKSITNTFQILRVFNITEGVFLKSISKFIESLKDEPNNKEKNKLILFLKNLISALIEKINSNDDSEKYANLFFEVIKKTHSDLDNEIFTNQYFQDPSHYSYLPSDMLDFRLINLPGRYKLIAMIITGICMDKVIEIEQSKEDLWDKTIGVENNIFVLNIEVGNINFKYLHELSKTINFTTPLSKPIIEFLLSSEPNSTSKQTWQSLNINQNHLTI
ncbi:MAG: hypothetical protein ACR2HS_03420, partial [Gammaproteobacteria bacterium]